MGATLGAVLAALVVALLKYVHERQDFRARVMAEAAKPGNEAAAQALRYLATGCVPTVRVRDGAGVIELDADPARTECPAAECPLRR